MITLKSLRIRNFRGFRDTDAGNFDLDSPITILYGRNGRGKSSTLNAIEWDLFGSDCSGTKTEIRERVNWTIANHHANPGEVTVELEIRDDDEIYLVRRELQSRARRKASDGDVEIELPDGECLTGAPAAQFLDRLHRSTFRDFATTVYQHQEAIRAIVTQEPRHRSDAIDRLLGLSDHRNLLNDLNKVDAKGWQKDFLNELNDFEKQIKTALQTRENDLDERRKEAGEAGVPRSRLNVRGALGIAREVQQALEQFAAEAGLEPVSVEVPLERNGIRPFCEAVRTSLNKLRGAIPAAVEQGELAERRGKVIRIKADLESEKKKQAEIGNDIRELDKDYGGQGTVNVQLAKVQEDIREEKVRLRETNARAALINESIRYLETETEKDQSSGLCPVCGNEAPNLLEALRQQWEDKLQDQVKISGDAIKSLESEETRLQIAAGKYKGWNDKLTASVGELIVQRNALSCFPQWLPTEPLAPSQPPCVGVALPRPPIPLLSPSGDIQVAL